MNYRDKVLDLNFPESSNYATYHQYRSGYAVARSNASDIAAEADKEIAELKRIIAEKDSAIADLGRALEDAQRFMG